MKVYLTKIINHCNIFKTEELALLHLKDYLKSCNLPFTDKQLIKMYIEEYDVIDFSPPK